MAVTPQPGDVVQAANEETGEVAYKEVVRTFVNTTDEITHVTIENAEGEQETIDSTPEHPFYVEGLGWVEASSLHTGMTIWFANGTKGTVEDISNEGLEEPITVYNFEVEDFHTYFVGVNGVLVHNTCNSRIEIIDEGTGEFKITDWDSYPDDYVPMPNQDTTFVLLEGSQYDTARASANSTNRAIRSSDPTIGQDKLEIHEIIPVKFSGSPTDASNKVYIQSEVHRSIVTPWWNSIMNEVKDALK